MKQTEQTFMQIIHKKHFCFAINCEHGIKYEIYIQLKNSQKFVLVVFHEVHHFNSTGIYSWHEMEIYFLNAC